MKREEDINPLLFIKKFFRDILFYWWYVEGGILNFNIPTNTIFNKILFKGEEF